MRAEPMVRFFAKVELGDCWQWVGNTNSSGYGQFWFEGAAPVAHRWIWEALVGPIPAGLEIDHLCKNRGCVNPDHLEPVTPAENVRRSSAPAAKNVVKQECSKGHAFDAENTHITRRGARSCRACQRGYRIKHEQRSRGAAVSA